MYVSVVSAKVAEQKLFIIIKKVGWKVGEESGQGGAPSGRSGEQKFYMKDRKVI